MIPLSDILKKLNYRDRKQISGCYGLWWYLGRRLITKGHKRTRWDDRNVLYLNWDSYIIVHICQNSTHYTFKNGEFYCL